MEAYLEQDLNWNCIFRDSSLDGLGLRNSGPGPDLEALREEDVSPKKSPIPKRSLGLSRCLCVCVCVCKRETGI